MYVAEFDEAVRPNQDLYIEIRLKNYTRNQRERVKEPSEFYEWLAFNGIAHQPLPMVPGWYKGSDGQPYSLVAPFMTFLPDDVAVHFKLRWFGGPMWLMK